MALPHYRTLPDALRTQRDWKGFIVPAVIASVLAVGVTFAHHFVPGFRVTLRDIGTVAISDDTVPVQTGYVVFVGAILWFAAATSGVLAWAVTRRTPELGRVPGMLLWFGLLMLLLGADDLFRFHDGVLLLYGVKERYTMLVILALAIAWGLSYLPEILRNRDLPIFAFGVLAFAHSMLVDRWDHIPLLSLANEESTKLAGVFLFAVWAWKTVLTVLAPKIPQRVTASPAA